MDFERRWDFEGDSGGCGEVEWEFGGGVEGRPLWLARWLLGLIVRGGMVEGEKKPSEERTA